MDKLLIQALRCLLHRAPPDHHGYYDRDVQDLVDKCRAAGVDIARVEESGVATTSRYRPTSSRTSGATSKMHCYTTTRTSMLGSLTHIQSECRCGSVIVRVDEISPSGVKTDGRQSFWKRHSQKAGDASELPEEMPHSG